MSARLRRAHPLDLAALAGLAAGLIALAVRISIFFERGSWLVAYLLLVGFLGPFLLAKGQRRLDPAGRRVGLQAGLWTVGVVAVPAGVFADARVLVAVGAVALWGSLAVMVADASRAEGGREETPVRLRRSHALVVAVMAVSAGVGLGLAWDRPWI